MMHSASRLSVVVVVTETWAPDVIGMAMRDSVARRGRVRVIEP